ncbi:hypothetical protein FKW77_008093 [Venturia effusa]|uniref:Dol-P-Glc:Glc(2)Man(9)GlcNAc(2)-PP-Dol alpha-1,2-glucosyltransferase n=1 Tax=Venturia effusa TaxID=50376 RepID=A0A517LLX9_9PEZI|nr:hypothetical protein FKW77_008093 [Venturia effusa]
MSKPRKDGDAESSHWIAVATAFVTACTAIWLANVTKIVPEAYLDEVFHVRQAQVYCNGHFHIWDQKITTPPGLYLVSWLIFKITGQCSITALRSLNVGTLMIAPYLTYKILYGLSPEPPSPANTRWSALSAANIWLFPPLFFFSGLYYTDVQSALWVLLSFQAFLRYEKDGFQSFSEAISFIRFGIIALFFRQTNIFWVAVFPAGLGAVSSLRGSAQKLAYVHNVNFWEMCEASWYESALYDPPVEDAWIEDYMKTIVSIVIVTVGNLPKLVRPLVPCIFLLAVFGGFVFWNGGVVLGDKSNHVATIHLSQMLYLWPYLVFFSIPALLPPIITSIVHVFACPPSVGSMLRRTLMFATSIILAAGVIHYNTIVHPFTLADNRHYVFYVFRILLRHPSIRYLAAPVYIFCAELTIQALGGSKPPHQVVEKSDQNSMAMMPVHGNTASFVIIWLATTALSLITAPLVEPRYCIIPWIMWRLHLPRPVVDNKEKGDDKESGLLAMLKNDQTRLALETAWFCCINTVTGYIFLYWGFSWPQEKGKIQRFMW